MKIDQNWKYNGGITVYTHKNLKNRYFSVQCLPVLNIFAPIFLMCPHGSFRLPLNLHSDTLYIHDTRTIDITCTSVISYLVMYTLYVLC